MAIACERKIKESTFNVVGSESITNALRRRRLCHRALGWNKLCDSEHPFHSKWIQRALRTRYLCTYRLTNYRRVIYEIYNPLHYRTAILSLFASRPKYLS